MKKEISHSSIQWDCRMHQGEPYWISDRSGFIITIDNEQTPERRYFASFNKGRAEGFPTLEGAKDWCYAELCLYLKRRIAKV